MCLDECRANGLDRRDFVAESGAALIALGGLGSPLARDGKPPPTRVLDDPFIQHGKVVFQDNGRDAIDGYLARPKADGAYQAVLVLARFVGLAPNVFHPIPDGTPNTSDAYARYIADHSDLERLDDVQVGASYLRAQPFVDPGGMGVVGFSSGGRMARPSALARARWTRSSPSTRRR